MRRKPPPRQPAVIDAEVVSETALVPQAPSAPVARLGGPETAATLFEVILATLSPNTRKAYAQDVRAFGRWWGEESPLERLVSYVDPGEARMTVLQYQAWMFDQELSSATVARRIRTLNSLVKKLRFAGKVDWVLDVSVDKVKLSKDVAGPGEEKWARLLDAVDSDRRWFGLRDAAMIRLMGRDNLRASEVGALKVSELRVRTRRRAKGKGTFEQMEGYIHGKGNKNLWHPLHSNTREVLEWWLDRRLEVLEDRGAEDLEWLFFTERLNPMSGVRVWNRVQKRADEAGIGKLHPHALRHFAITQRARNWTGPHATLVKWARHSNANMTQRYIDDISDQVAEIAELGD